MYPKNCDQPMHVDDLFTGKLEPTSRAYATSKIASLELGFAFNKQSNTDRFLCLIPNSVFGPFDNFDPESGHVLSSLISRFHRARETQKALLLYGAQVSHCVNSYFLRIWLTQLCSCLSKALQHQTHQSTLAAAMK